MGVALEPNAVMARVVAVVAGEDDDRVVGDAQLVDRLQHASHVAVDADDTGVVLARHALDLADVQLGKVGLGQFDVQVFERRPVFFARGQPGGVRLAIVQRQQERLLAVALEELQGVVGHHVDDEALGLHVFAVDFQHGVARRAAAIAKADELVVAAARGIVSIGRAQVPFAEQPGVITGLLQQLHPGGELHVEAQFLLFARVDPVGDAQLGRVTAGNQAGARGAAHRRGDEGIGEDGALAGNAVDVGRAQLLGPAKPTAVGDRSSVSMKTMLGRAWFSCLAGPVSSARINAAPVIKQQTPIVASKTRSRCDVSAWCRFVMVAAR